MERETYKSLIWGAEIVLKPPYSLWRYPEEADLGLEAGTRMNTLNMFSQEFKHITTKKLAPSNNDSETASMVASKSHAGPLSSPGRAPTSGSRQ